MSTCPVCGNECDRTVEVVTQDGTLVFDRLECALSQLATTCQRCGWRVVDQGIDTDDVHCSADCALAAGATRVTDLNERGGGVAR